MNNSMAKCGKSALVTSDWLVRSECKPEANRMYFRQQAESTFQRSKEHVMKRFFKILKTQEVALAISLVWMVVWAGVAMSEAFNHIA